MSNNTREKYVYFFFLFSFLILSCRIVYLQIFRRDFFQKIADSQYYRIIPFEGRRGKIFDCHGRVLSTTISCYSIFADPFLIKEPQTTAKALASFLGLSFYEVEAKLKKKTRFVWIARRISWNDKEKVKALNLEGVSFIRDEKRFYPQGRLASLILGLTDIDSKGIEGLDLFYDNYLSGKNGWVRILQDSSCRQIILSPQITAPQPGADMVSTIDVQIQYWTEIYLEETVKKFKAKDGSVVVMDASSGQILALANYPDFDPNNINGVPFWRLKNRAVCDMFEPGSVFKVVTLIAALEEGRFSERDTIFCENGEYKIPGATVHDWKPYGTLSFKEVFKKSSNIGVGKIANTLGPEKIYFYMKKLKLGEKTGIDLPGEVSGKVKPVKYWSKTSSYIIPIGQEVGTNLLQLVRTFAVVANGGYLVQPYVIKTIYSETFAKNTVVKKERVISSQSAQRAKDILIEVVKDGTGKLGDIQGVAVGGKTGTAQKYDPAIGRYSSCDYRANFIGFISEVNPPIVIGITVNEPRGSHFGGVVSAPLFKKIAEKIVVYMEGDKILVKK